MPKRAKAQSTTPTANPERVLIMDQNGTEFKVTIPAGSRVTFGPTIPYQKGNPINYATDSSGYSLRVYANKAADSIIACFAGVRSFRWVELPYFKLIVREAGKSMWQSTEKGFKTETETTYEHAEVRQLR